MSSVTRQLKNNKNLVAFLEKTSEKLIKISRISTIKNMYPNYISENKLFAFMGTYTDYMMRKMLSEIYSINIENKTLICELSRSLMNTLNPIKNGEMKCNNMNTIPLKPVQSFNDIYTWILNYKDPSKSWKDVIENTFYIAQTDSLYRAGIINEKIIFPTEYFNQFKTFFDNIFNFLQKMHFTPPITLNPNIGITNCPADADIIDENCIYDIKTSKYNPDKHDIFQLLCYLSLYYYHYGKRTNYIAVVNPIYLEVEKYDCKDIENNYLNRITNLLRYSIQ